MNNVPTAIEALMADLERLGMSQSQFVFRLGPDQDGSAVTESAISMWKKRGNIPRKWERRVVEILGRDSLTARVLEDQFAQRWSDQRYVIDVQAIAPAIREALGAPSAPPVNELALPEELQKYQGRRAIEGIDFLGIVGRADYISPRVVADLKWAVSATVNPTVYRSLFQFAAIRQRDTNKNRHYGVILVDPQDQVQNTARLRVEALMLGVTFEVVRSLEMAAKLIEGWENGHLDAD
jgi:hypothetical protein